MIMIHRDDRRSPLAVKWKSLVELGCELPEVEEGKWYRTPALMVHGKGFVRLKEDGQSVVFLLEHIGEREGLIASQPDVYFTTDHYRKTAAVLARLSNLRVGAARRRLEEAWRVKAPKVLLKKYDEA